MKKSSENFLERVPIRNKSLNWNMEKGTVIIKRDNKGLFNKIVQVIFNKPKVSYVHLDKIGSFIWQNIDDEINLLDLGKLLEKKFGKEINPLYERLAQYFVALENCGFIMWADK